MPGLPGGGGDPVPLAEPEHGGGGVVGVGEQHHLGLVGDRLLKGVHVELVAVLGVQGDVDGDGAHELGVEEVAGVAGVGHQHLVSGIQKDVHGVEQPGVGAGGDDDVAPGVHLHPVVGLELLCDLLPQLQRADGHGVVGGEAAVDALVHGPAHHLGEGGVGEEGVGPAHEHHLARHGGEVIPHVGLGHLGEKPPLHPLEAGGNLLLTSHVGPPYKAAMASISTLAPLGRAETSTTKRAGASSPKKL